MTTTKPVIRRKAGIYAGTDLAFVSADGVNGLTASGGSTTTLVDAGAAPPNGYSSNTHQNWHIYLPGASAADQVRVVASYSGSNRTWTIDTGENYATPPADADSYLILKEHPQFEWDTSLNLALTQKCFFARYHEFDPTSETQSRYIVTSAPISITASDITSVAQFVALEWRDENEASGEEEWKTYYGPWEVIEDEGTYTLDTFGRHLNTARTWRFVYTMPYAALSDESTTSNVNPDYAAWATLLTMGERLGDHNNPEDRWEQIRRKASAKYDEYHRRALGKYVGRVVIQPQVRRPGVSVMGRRG